MIGVINPVRVQKSKQTAGTDFLQNATQTLEVQMQWALNTTEEFSPGQVFLPEGPQTTVVRTTTYTGATAAPTAPPATSSYAPPVATKSSSLPVGAIVGIAIGGFAVLVLAAALIYMCGRQKTIKELLRQSTISPSHNSYQPGSPGFSEAHYANMQKPPDMSVSGDGRYSAQGFVAPTERSMSPPVTEQTGMMGMHPMHAESQGYPSPGFMSPNSPGYPSPAYSDNVRHEMGAQGARYV